LPRQIGRLWRLSLRSLPLPLPPLKAAVFARFGDLWYGSPYVIKGEPS